MNDLLKTALVNVLIFTLAVTVRVAFFMSADPAHAVAAQASSPLCAPHPVKFPCFKDEATRS